MRATVVTVVLLAAAACGGGDGGADGANDQRGAREVTLRVTDGLRFEPAQVTAAPGERVTFVVSNVGTVDHELVVGSAAFLAAHAASSDAHAGHGNDDQDGAAVDVPAGRTARLTFVMPDAAPSFACFVDRHDKAGMTGTVSYA